MEKLKKILLAVVAFIVVEFVLLGCIVSGVIVPGGYASIDNKQNTETIQENINKDFVQYSLSPLDVKLSGIYLNEYNKATENLGDDVSDRNRKLVALIGLQILQSKVIKYECKLHFYSLSYTSSGAVQGAKYYSLLDCINRINARKYIYTDCFGFVRLTHSIAAYSINKTNPESVSGLGGLYGYKGSYTGNAITSLSKLKCSTLIYDRLTGSNSSKNRHVAIFLYATGNNVVYMDQAGIFKGTFKDSSYIYYAKANPYKFNTFKSYC